MITPDEVRLYIPYAPEDSCTTISRYIKNLYNRKYKFLSGAEYDIEIVAILTRVGINYNPRLGPLVRYTKNTLSLKIKDFIKRSYEFTAQIDEDTTVETLVEKLEDQDLTGYSDASIRAIYNVINGNGSKKDKDIVSNLFNTKE